MTLYPVPLDQRHAQTLQGMQTAIKTLQARTMGIDSGIPLMSLPGQIDPGYPGDGSNPMAYVNGSAELTGPYEYLASYFPVAGQAVTMLPVQQSYIILSSAGPAAATRLPGTLEVDGAATFENTATFDGNTSVAGILNAQATNVNGMLTANGGCQVINGLYADQEKVGGNLQVVGDTVTNGDTFANGDLQVEGATFLDNTTKVTATLEVTDHFFADNSVSVGTYVTFTELAGVSGVPPNSLIVSGGSPSLLYFIDSNNTVHQIAFA